MSQEILDAIQDLRNEMKTETRKLRDEMKSGMKELSKEIESVKASANGNHMQMERMLQRNENNIKKVLF